MSAIVRRKKEKKKRKEQIKEKKKNIKPVERYRIKISINCRLRTIICNN